MEELLALVNGRRARDRGVTRDDVEQALRGLDKLGGGVRIVKLGGSPGVDASNPAGAAAAAAAGGARARGGGGGAGGGDAVEAILSVPRELSVD